MIKVIDVMIDLETLGTTPGSVVLSIGAAASDSYTGPDDLNFHGKIDVRDSLHAGLTVDPDTMSWWRKQPADVWRETVQAGEDPDLGLRSVLGRFTEWLATLRKGDPQSKTGAKLRLWGDSASFDLGLLAAACRAAGQPQPWSYQEEYCYRTLRNVLESEKPRSKTQHDGLSDAQAQLAHLQMMLDALKKAGVAK